MMFLEQDPVITITVARVLGPDRSCGLGLSVRRVDSCGSLDSHTQYSTTPSRPDNQPPPLNRVYSPQELRSPLKHFQPSGLHGNKLNGMSRSSPHRTAVKKTPAVPLLPAQRPSGPHVMHLRAQSAPAPETQV